jgi:hypothetical protein
VKADLALPVLQVLPDGSYLSVLVNPRIGGKAREALTEVARAGEDLGEAIVSPPKRGSTPAGSNSPHCPHRPPGHRPGGLSPEQHEHGFAAVGADITRKRNLNPAPPPDLPALVKRARHSSYRVERPSDQGIRHSQPLTTKPANRRLSLAA